MRPDITVLHPGHSRPRRRADDVPWDSSLALREDPYHFIASRCRALHKDLFETRILLHPTVCMTGPAAAEVFYDVRRFQRAGAAPEPVLATLFGKGGVQGLDGAAHRHRKALFMNVMSPAQTRRLVALAEREWERALPSWTMRAPTSLYRLLHEVLTVSVCAWAGVPLARDELPLRTHQLVALFDSAAAGVWGHLEARSARLRAEAWLARIVDDVRAGRSAAPAGTALHAVTHHRDAEGATLPSRIAAVELLNVLRPTVATSIYIVFVAHALQTNPEGQLALMHGNDETYIDCFVEEVRRDYPFFPAVTALVREDFEWNGYRFRHGQRALFDLYGTNHDPRSWDAPDEFQPERHARRIPTPFELVPQGGADVATNHRCAGEGTTVMLMKMAANFLVNRMQYEVPDQDLRIDMRRLPALPRDGFVIASPRLAC